MQSNVTLLKLSLFFRCFGDNILYDGFIMLHNKLLNSVNIPYSAVKGSFASRQQKAEQFTHRVVNNISGTLKQNDISLFKLAKLIKKQLPANLKVVFRRDTAADSGAQFNWIFTKSDNIGGYAFEFKLNDNNFINFIQIPSIAHEIRHLADSLFHPKILAREQIRAKKKLNYNKFSDFYDEDIYVKEQFNGKKDKKRIIKAIKHKTQKILKGLSSQDKIDILQSMRYNLISERNAYNTCSKYAKKLYKRYFPVYEDFLYNQTKEYMFDEKIKLLHDMIFKLIKKERGLHRANIKRKSV